MISKRQFFALFALMFISGLNCQSDSASNTYNCLLNNKLDATRQSQNDILDAYQSLTATIEIPATINYNDSFTVIATVINSKRVCLPSYVQVLLGEGLELDPSSILTFSACICDYARNRIRVRAINRNSTVMNRIALRIFTLKDSAKCPNFVWDYPREVEVYRTSRNFYVKNAEPLDGVFKLDSQYYLGRYLYLFNNKKDKNLYFWNSGSDMPISTSFEIRSFNRTFNGRTLYTIRNVETNQYLTTATSFWDYSHQRRNILGVDLDSTAVANCAFLWQFIPNEDKTYYIIPLNGEYLYTASKFADFGQRQGYAFTWAATNDDGQWSGSEDQKRKWFLRPVQ